MAPGTWRDLMSKKTPDPLEPAGIPGQNPATPERMPGHTTYYDDDKGEAENKIQSEAEPKAGAGRDPDAGRERSQAERDLRQVHTK
jgi:hypothetical protein